MNLHSKEGRRKWENEFSRFYVQPVLSSLDVHLNKTMEAIHADSIHGTHI